MHTRALLFLTGIAIVAANGFAQDKKSPAAKSVAEPGSGGHRITAAAIPGATSGKDDVAGTSSKAKKQRIRYTYPPAAAKRM